MKITLALLSALAGSAYAIPRAALPNTSGDDVFILTLPISQPGSNSSPGAANVTAVDASTLELAGRGLPLEARASLQDTMLSLHNSFRAKYGAAPLTWSTSLASGAASWSQACVFQHSGGNYGENLAAGSGSFTAEAGFQLWANEASQYDYNNPGFSSATGHFTQVVWKSSKEVGCGFSSCASGTIFAGFTSQYLVCRYNPPGNYLDQFPANVGRPQ